MPEEPADVDAGLVHREFVSVYDEQFVRLVRVAYLTTGSGPAAEDLVHDAFVELLRRWQHVRNPREYVRRAVVSRTTSWVRRRVVERRYAGSSTLDDSEWHDSDTTVVVDVLRGLSARQRAAVVLSYLDGLTEAEVASALHCRPGTVKSLLSRSRSITKEALSE